MSYCCTYDLIKNDDSIDQIYYSACFSCHWNSFHNYKSMKYYIFKDYNDINEYTSPENKMIDFTKKELLEYIKIINKLGCKITTNLNDIYKTNKAKCYSFEIPIENILIFKIAINMLRYMHEEPNINHIICKTLLKVDKELKTLHIINKIILSHYSSLTSGGHGLFNSLTLVRLMSKKEFSDKLEKNKTNMKESLNEQFESINHRLIKDFDYRIIKEILEKDVKKAYYCYKKYLKHL